MKTVISNMIRITDPTEDVKAYLNTLKLPNPEYEKKQRMGFWLGRTPKEIRMYEWDGNTVVLPFGLLKEVWPMIRIYPFETDFRQNEVINYGEMTGLYDYQKKAVQSMIDAKYGILKSPAGSGKTQCGIAMIMRIQRKTLWLCHTADLLHQSMERAERYIPDEWIGTITEGKINIGKGITFATIQTMCNTDLDRYRHEWDVVIVDECHRISQSATTVSRYQKVLNNLAARHKYGLTATPERSDGLIRATYSLIGPIAYEVPEESVKDKIMTVTVRPVETETEITEDCLNTDGTIDYGKLIAHLTTDEKRNRLIASCIQENRGHSCLILSDRLEHLDTIRKMLPEDIIQESGAVSGKMTTKAGKELREQYIEEMRTGKTKYLFATYSLAKEGLDIPRLDRLFMVSPVKFSSVVIQSIGRIARTFEGKENPVCYDFVDKNIGFCERAYKERCKHYRKIHCTIERGFLKDDG